jgi:predicted nucleic acid-binding protein
VSLGLDTSVLLRLLVGQPADQAQRAVEFLEALGRRGDRAVVSDLVVAEVYFALHYHYAVPKKEALAALRKMFADGEIKPAGVAADVLTAEGAALASAKPGFVDRMIQSAYVSSGGSMATFEKASGKLKSVQVL